MAVESTGAKVTCWVLLLFVALLSILPFIWIVMGSFKPHMEIQKGHIYPWQSFEAKDPSSETGMVRKHVTLANYTSIFKQLAGLPTYYFNTLYLSITGTFLAIFLGTMAAYGFSKFKFFGNKVLFTMLLATIMIPMEVSLIGRYELMFNLKLFDRITGLLIAYSAGNLMMVIFIMRNIFNSIPDAVVDAAMIDGANSWQVFWNIMVPVGFNGLAACAILTFLNIWNEFMFALTFTSQSRVRTLPVGITMLKGQFGSVESGILFAVVLLSFLPIVIVFILLQKYFVRGLSAGALKG
ncbi:MAG: carbohydrate ABC transporter permease [Planctomycetes bacterium]|nr:carbohydrate ABC transporter permease [Planctomycetota bacterium]